MKVLILLSMTSLCFGQSSLRGQRTCKTIYESAMLKKELTAIGIGAAGVGVASYKNSISPENSRGSSVAFIASATAALSFFLIDFKKKGKFLKLIDNAYDYRNGATSGIKTLVQAQTRLNQEGANITLDQLAEEVITRNEDLSLCAGKTLKYSKVLKVVEAHI